MRYFADTVDPYVVHERRSDWGVFEYDPDDLGVKAELVERFADQTGAETRADELNMRAVEEGGLSYRVDVRTDPRSTSPSPADIRAAIKDRFGDALFVRVERI